MPTAWEREQARAFKERHLAEREADVSRRNELIDRELANLDSILSVGTSRNIVLDHNARKLPPPVFECWGTRYSLCRANSGRILAS